jgi:hypothetical protein
MPAFAEYPGDASDNILSREAIDLIVDWLRGEWYEPPADPAASADDPVAAK